MQSVSSLFLKPATVFSGSGPNLARGVLPSRDGHWRGVCISIIAQFQFYRSLASVPMLWWACMAAS